MASNLTTKDNGFPIASPDSDPNSEDTNQLSLFSPSPSPLPLKAYLASALSQLSDDDRNYLFYVSDLINEICSENGVDLYQPRHFTDPKLHPDVSANDVFENDRNKVLNSDMVIHLCHHPSTGAGEELEFARAALLPIILIYPDKVKVSRMVLGIPSLVIQIAYRDFDHLQSQLTKVLFDFRPLFEERKLAFSSYNKNIVGEKIREIRQKAQLTRQEVAEASKKLTVERLTVLEEKTDLESAPSLLELREIATILKTTVSEIAEPDLTRQVFTALKNWVEGREAARTIISKEDQRKIIKGMMYRMADWI